MKRKKTMSKLEALKDNVVLTIDSYSMEDAFALSHVLGSGAGDALLRRFEFEGIAADTLTEEVTKLFGDPILTHEDTNAKSYWNEYKTSLSSVRLYVSIGKDETNVQLKGATLDESIYNKVKALAKKLIEKHQPTNNIYALMSSQSGLSLRSIGKVEHTLVEANYSKDAIEGYKHAVACLGSKDPCGRIVLFQGPPGTGKSYMIRSLVSSVKSTFIVVGAHMISELSGPSILPVILGCVDTEDPRPITFILEDSDVALANRKSGGVTALSGLLNLGDGLLGEMLDIRILATTNAEMLDLDPAVVRPGRMCNHIKLTPFNTKDATALYCSMVKNQTAILRKPTTLAEIYRMAREDGWKPEVTEDKPEAGQYL
jgi:hypothetical protein